MNPWLKIFGIVLLALCIFDGIYSLALEKSDRLDSDKDIQDK